MAIPQTIYALIEPFSGKVRMASKNKRETMCRCIGFNDFVGHKWGLNDVGIVVEYGYKGAKQVEIPQELIDSLTKKVSN